VGRGRKDGNHNVYANLQFKDFDIQNINIHIRKKTILEARMERNGKRDWTNAREAAFHKRPVQKMVGNESRSKLKS